MFINIYEGFPKTSAMSLLWKTWLLLVFMSEECFDIERILVKAFSWAKSAFLVLIPHAE